MCGRQPEGENAEKLGVCPSTVTFIYDGTNKGTYAGRFCWAVAGTFCDGKQQGTYAEKFKNCLNCEFLKQVNEKEDRDFVLTPKDAINKTE